jgi:hypothetical protein
MLPIQVKKKSLTISNKATAMIMAILYFAKINKWEDIEEIPFWSVEWCYKMEIHIEEAFSDKQDTICIKQKLSSLPLKFSKRLKELFLSNNILLMIKLLFPIEFSFMILLFLKLELWNMLQCLTYLEWPSKKS